MGELNLKPAAARTGLTKQQKKEAEAAIYGMKYAPIPTGDVQLTQEQQFRREQEAEELRAILRKLEGAIL